MPSISFPCLLLYVNCTEEARLQAEREEAARKEKEKEEAEERRRLENEVHFDRLIECLSLCQMLILHYSDNYI